MLTFFQQKIAYLARKYKPKNKNNQEALNSKIKTKKEHLLSDIINKNNYKHKN